MQKPDKDEDDGSKPPNRDRQSIRHHRLEQQKLQQQISQSIKDDGSGGKSTSTNTISGIRRSTIPRTVSSDQTSSVASPSVTSSVTDNSPGAHSCIPGEGTFPVSYRLNAPPTPTSVYNDRTNTNSGDRHEQNATFIPVLEAHPVQEEEPVKAIKMNFWSRHRTTIIISAFLVTAFVFLVAFLGGGGSGRNNQRSQKQQDSTPTQNDNDNTGGVDDRENQPQVPLLPRIPTLQAIKARGFIRCKTSPFEFQDNDGFTIDLCKALSAAIFNGDPNRFQLVVNDWIEQWGAIENGTIDVSTAQVTHTMEREIREPNSGVGFAFSTPYVYTGTVFGGIPEYVKCAEEGDALLGICQHLMVCVKDGTTTEAAIANHLNGAATFLISDNNTTTYFDGLLRGDCNVIAGEPLNIYEQNARKSGFRGNYTVGTKFISLDPLAIVSRGDDVEFANLCNWVVQALYSAEGLGVTQSVVDTIIRTETSGDIREHELIFYNVIRAVGNYGELFAKHYEDRFPRSGRNLLNQGDSGLLLAHPFGNLDIPQDFQREAPGPTPNGTLEMLRKNDNFLRCGVVSGRPGFATLDNLSGEWKGIDTDFCRAVAVALHGGGEDLRLEFVNVTTAEEGFSALSSGDIDIFAGAPYTIWNDIKGLVSDENGFSFSPAYFYNDEDGSGALTIATREDDNQWSGFVRWVVFSTFYAEENDLSSDDAGRLPAVDLFGVAYDKMFRYVSVAVGNYGDIYKRNLGPFDNDDNDDGNKVVSIPRSGRNEPNEGGPMQNPLSDFLQTNS